MAYDRYPLTIQLYNTAALYYIKLIKQVYVNCKLQPDEVGMLLGLILGGKSSSGRGVGLSMCLSYHLSYLVLEY